MTTSGTSRCQSRSGALADQVSLKLRQRAEDMEHEPSTRSARVEALPQTAQGHATTVEITDDINQMAQRPTKTVEAPHHDRVTRSKLREHLVETRTVFQLPRCPVHEDAVTPRRLKRISLQSLVLFERRNTGIAKAEPTRILRTHDAPSLLDVDCEHGL